MITDSVSLRDKHLSDAVSADTHPQMTRLRKQLGEKDNELQILKTIIHDQITMMDGIEQYDRRGTLRCACIPEHPNHDALDGIII